MAGGFQYPGFQFPGFQIDANAGDVDATLPALTCDAHGTVGIQVQRRGGGKPLLPDEYYFRKQQQPQPERQGVYGRADVTLPMIGSSSEQFTDEEFEEIMQILADLELAA